MQITMCPTITLPFNPWPVELNTDLTSYHFLKDTVDPDQMASSEAIIPESTPSYDLIENKC